MQQNPCCTVCEVDECLGEDADPDDDHQGRYHRQDVPLRLRDLRARGLSDVHVHDHPKVIVQGESAVEGEEDREPYKA